MSWQGRMRLAELLASLSLATDLGTGQPLGHGMRTCLLAVSLARELGCDPPRVRSVYQVALLRFLGCTADSHETAAMTGGDDLFFNAAMAPTLGSSSGEALMALVRTVGQGRPPIRKARLVVGALADPGAAARGLAAHCEVAAMLARRLGLDAGVTGALRHAYERWDGGGFPEGLSGEAIPLEIRIASVARDVDLFRRSGEDVDGLLRRRSGRAHDPDVVDAFGRLDPGLIEADWQALMAAEPPPVAHVDDVEQALRVVADFVDMKSPWTRGHSTRVAALAERAGVEAGLPGSEREDLRLAGLVHDLGRLGIENGIWDKPGPLSIDEWEKVWLHPYLTDRILARCPTLAALGDLAACHHERLDGSGYHRHSRTEQLDVPARILGAADVWVALTSRRPHRDALSLDGALEVLTEEVEAGRLDRSASAWVASAAGADVEAPGPGNPDGLTDREVEVLRLVASGLTNREIGGELYISPKTVGRHVENIYAKVGVSTRAGAAVYAMEHRLLT